ncbi:MAG: hypothetical protein JNM07_04765 [Phycisphaerae bacterium]|nr:hypothetical protein [Phycisphaerae bacterium]
MRIEANRSTPRALLAAVALTCAAGGSAMASRPSPAAAPPTSPSVSDLSTRAETHLRRGQVIRAKAATVDLMRSLEKQDASLSEWKAAEELLVRVEGRVKATDAIEVSLQRAELAVEEGDLPQAERHANAALQSSGASDAAKARARDVQALVQSRRDELRPLISDMLTRAAADCDAGRYAESKSALAAVRSSGVTLSDSEQALLDTYQLRVTEQEKVVGRPFEAPIFSPAAFQPGVVKRKKVQPGESSPPAVQPVSDQNPASRPASSQPATEPSSTPSPTPSPTPAAEPPSAPAPAAAAPATPPPPAPVAPSAPPVDDIVRTALKVDGQRVLAEADQSFTMGRFNEAIQKYEQVLAGYRPYMSNEELAHAERRVTESRGRLGAGTGADLAGTVQDTLRLQREQAEAEYANEVAEAAKSLEAGDTGRAKGLVERARLTITRRQSVFSEAEFRSRIDDLDALSRRIDDASESIRKTEAARQERDIQDKSSRAQRDLRAEKDRKLRESIDRIRALQQEQRYDEALQVCEQVLFLDPNNPTGLLLRDVLGDVTIFKRAEQIRKTKSLRQAMASIESLEAGIMPRGIIDYPTDWRTKSAMRGDPSALGDTPETRRLLGALETRELQAKFQGNELADVLDYVREAAGVEMDVDWTSLAAIGVDRSSPVTMNLSRVPAGRLLTMVLEKASKDPVHKARWAAQDGMVQVAAEQDLRRAPKTEIYNITDLLLETIDNPKTPETDLGTILERAQRSQASTESPFGRNARAWAEKDVERSSRRDRVRKYIEIIQTHVDPAGWRDAGGEIGTIQGLENGTLIVTTTPANHKEIQGLLSKLREVRQMQINVETRFLLVNQDWFEQIGFDIDVYLNANNNQFRAARGNDPSVQPSDFFDFTQGGLSRTVTGAGQAPVTQNVVNPRPNSLIGTEQNSLGLVGQLASDNNFASRILGAAPALGIAGQFLDDVQVNFLVRATQADRRSITLTAPRLTFTNGQISNVYVATQRSFISDLNPVVGQSAVGFDPVPAPLTEGVRLLVEGVVSSDRRYVTLNVDTSVSRLERLDTQPVTAVAGGQLVNSADTQSFIQLPLITTTRVQTTVTVPDEGTVLLGGQRLVTELEVETGVPVLSKIPIINRFFTNRVEAKNEQTLLILLKPTVLIQAEEEEKNFPGLPDSMRTSGLGG